MYSEREVSMLELRESIELSPRPVISALKSESKITYVVRDDLLPGGTKQRAAGPYIEGLIQEGYSHFVYASPFSGFAQVALASICNMLGQRCTIVCEKDQRYEDRRFHPFSLKAREFGARIILVDSLQEAESVSLQLQDEKTVKIPLGFDCEEFRSHLALVFLDALKEIKRVCGNIQTLWMPVGSGTLVRTLLTVLPDTIQIKCVNVRVLSSEDARLQKLISHPSVEFFEAPVPFRVEAEDLPSIPSNLFYDAKLWSFIKEYGHHGDVWWNVAR